MISKIILMAIFSIGFIACTEKTLTPTQANNTESYNGIIKVEKDCGWSIVVDSSDLKQFEKSH